MFIFIQILLYSIINLMHIFLNDAKKQHIFAETCL
jgi:hypothetical protein